MDYFNRRRMRLFWALLASAFLLIFAACGDDDPASGLDFESFLEDTSAAEGAVAEGDALIDSVLPNPYSRLDGHHERFGSGFLCSRHAYLGPGDYHRQPGH